MRAPVLLCLILMACDSPSLAMRNVAAQRVQVDGFAFAVRVRGDRAEAIRTSRNWLPRERAVFDAATEAVERVSGCAVRSVDGDQAIVTARLRCGKTPATVPVLAVLPKPI